MGGDESPAPLSPERWLPVPWCPGHYEVSDLGRVRRVRPYRTTFAGKVLKPKLSLGYPKVSLSVNGVKTDAFVHGLVAVAFFGERPDGFVVNHKNAIKTDDRLENLEYVTVAENNRHAVRVGAHRAPSGQNHSSRTHPELYRGERNGSAKLNEAQIRDIRQRCAEGQSQRSVARFYSIESSHVCNIVARKVWAHVV